MGLTDTEMDGTDAKDSIPSTLRLLIIIEEMAEAGVPVTPTELNKSLGLPKPTIHRMFTQLEDEGFVQREIDGSGYSPGRRLRKLSAGVLSSLRIRTARTAILTRLAEVIGETCNISLPDDDQMIYVERVETKWPLRIQLPTGTKVPLHCTASGKLFLASLSATQLTSYFKTTTLGAQTDRTITDPDDLKRELSEVRVNGYATDNQEFVDGMVAVGVPIRDGNDRLMSTLSVHAPIQRLTLKDALLHVPLLHETAHELANLFIDEESPAR